MAQKLAILQGCEAAALAPSTLHLFWDLFGMLAIGGVAIYADAGVYPIPRWGIERAAARGVPVRNFPHHDVDVLRRQLKQDAQRGLQPFVVADGFCPGCGRPAPIAPYLDSIRAFGGYLMLDDTQALGIFGYSPGPGAPYGKGGGGSLRWHNAGGSDVLLVSSLAKSFGVPIAVLSASHAMVRKFEERSETRVHCSPPSVAVIRAAEHALAVNQEHGDALRMRLGQLVRRFRQGLAEAGFSARGGLFPVQTLALSPDFDAASLHAHLLRLGVRTVLRRTRNDYGPCINFLITALHSPTDIDLALDALAHTAQWR